jgi:hypothetical protein
MKGGGIYEYDLFLQWLVSQNRRLESLVNSEPTVMTNMVATLP